MSNLYVPPCPTDCYGALGEVDFDLCAPILHWGEISYLYVARADFPEFADDTTFAAAWAAAELAGTIKKLTVLGDLPEPEITEVPMSGDRIAVGYKTFTLNFEVDETNDTNYLFLQMTECGNKFKIWFETFDGLLYGGKLGITATLKMNLLIPRGRKELSKFMGKAKWDALHSPYRIDTPWV